MRYLVLSDIHANLEALEACLRDAGTRGCDQTLVLGDIVGYGADPNAVVARVQELKPAALVRGNHDKVACGLDDADGFNPVARSAAYWTRDALTAEHRRWLAALPRGPQLVDDLIEICHGSPLDEDLYVLDELDALRALKRARRPVCLFGHTHCPSTFRLAGGMLESHGPATSGAVEIHLRSGAKYLVNPGSVGQPRDGDPRAAYAIVDTTGRHIALHRVSYAVEVAQNKIVEAGLPEVLARRLAAGR